MQRKVIWSLSVPYVLSVWRNCGIAAEEASHYGASCSYWAVVPDVDCAQRNP